MVRTVSAAQANREFSKLMKIAQGGEEVLVTSRGKPAVNIVPAPLQDNEMERRHEAWDAFTELLRQQPTLNLPRLTRDDFYE